MPVEPNYYDETFSFLLSSPSLPDQPSLPPRKSSQETVRPRLSRAVTMPSSQLYNHTMLPEAAYYPAYEVFHTTATTPTSPSASSTTGSHLSSSADEYDYTRTYNPTGPAPQMTPFSTNAQTPMIVKSEDEADSAHKIARPPNAWILYRSKKLAEFKNSNPKMYSGKNPMRNKSDRGIRPTQASFSKQIANMWAAEPAEVKEAYHEEASIRSMMHAIEHPGYRFNPNKKRADKPKVKRERTKSTSPKQATAHLRIATSPINQTPSPGMVSTYFPSPVMQQSPALSQTQNSPYRQNDFQWALSPPAGTAAVLSSSQGSASSLDARYAQERRPSLKAQWEAIFPPEGQDGSTSASSCSTSFSSNHTGPGSVSPLWGTGLLPSLSINEPLYTDTMPQMPSTLPGAFVVDEGNVASYTPAASIASSSPVQYAFAPPALALPSEAQYPFWPSVQDNQDGNVGMVAPSLDFAEPALASPAFPNIATTPMEQQSTGPDVIPVPQIETPMPFTEVSSLNQVGQLDTNLSIPTGSSAPQPGLDTAAWWPYRHLKVKQDDVDGIPLEELIKSLGDN